MAVGEEMKPRDAMPLDTMFMNGVMMAKAKVRREDNQPGGEPRIRPANPPAGFGTGGLGGRDLVNPGGEPHIRPAIPPPGFGVGGLGGRDLEARQWGCESVGQINCVFKGCCKCPD